MGFKNKNWLQIKVCCTYNNTNMYSINIYWCRGELSITGKYQYWAIGLAWRAIGWLSCYKLKRQYREKQWPFLLLPNKETISWLAITWFFLPLLPIKEAVSWYAIPLFVYHCCFFKKETISWLAMTWFFLPLLPT